MLGIHQFTIDNHRSAFFVERPFGNYLIFSDHLKSTDFEFIKSKGGVYKQFFESSSSINKYHAKIFDLYGAPAVVNAVFEIQNEHLPVERIGIEFADPSFEFDFSENSKKFIFKQRGENVMILGEDYYLNSENNILFKNKDITREILNQIVLKDIKYVFFTHFEKSAFYEIGKVIPWWKRILYKGFGLTGS